MIDPQEFLQNVLASDDDQARLVYADWLEERGDLGRAELIRAQCTLAATRSWERAALEASWRADAMLAEHGPRFRTELPALDGVEWTDFERGFPATVKVADVATLYRHAEAIGAAAPVYRAHLDTFDESGDPYVAGSVPWLRALRITSRDGIAVNRESSLLGAPLELEIVGVEEYQGLDWLAGNARVATLAKLHVEGQHVLGRQFTEGLVAAPWAGSLKHLAFGTRFVDYDSGYFTEPTLGAQGGVELAALDRLEVLDISRQRVRDDGLAALVSQLPALRELDARAAEATSVAALAASEGAPFVRLDLSLNPIGDAGAKLLASASRLAGLESLALDTCELTSAGVAALVEAPCWQTLRVLDLSRNPLGLRGVQALAGAAVPAHLHTLRLADADLDAAAVAALVAIPWVAQLAVLDLSRNALGASFAALASLAGGALRQLGLARTGIVELAPLAHLARQLVHLELSRCEIGDAGIAVLADAACAELQVLDLDSCGVTAAGFAQLYRAPLPRLRWLDLSRNPLEVPSLAGFLASPLAARLEHLSLAHVPDLPLAHANARVAELASTDRLARLRLLDLRGYFIDAAHALALARSKALPTTVEVRLCGDLWGWAQGAREEVLTRFGRACFWYEEDDDQLAE